MAFKSRDYERKYNCIICGKEFVVKRTLLHNERLCSKRCINKFNKKYPLIKKCLFCGKDFHAIKPFSKFCGYYCKNQYNEIHAPEYEYKCDNCGKTYFSKKKYGELNFCSKECYSEYDHANRFKPIIQCEICGKDMIRKYPKQRFCSMECQSKWQSLYRENTAYPRKQTTIELEIANILSKNNILFEENKKFSWYEIDLFLTKYNIGIEIMGRYWHGDTRDYSFINKIQLENIRRDKRKRTYIFNKYNFKILYLWEKDIRENPELCEKLIKLYIKNNGILNNYNSFNYYINQGEIKEKDNIEKSFMEWEDKDLKAITKDKRVTK